MGCVGAFSSCVGFRKGLFWTTLNGISFWEAKVALHLHLGGGAAARKWQNARDPPLAFEGGGRVRPPCKRTCILQIKDSPQQGRAGPGRPGRPGRARAWLGRPAGLGPAGPGRAGPGRLAWPGWPGQPGAGPGRPNRAGPARPGWARPDRQGRAGPAGLGEAGQAGLGQPARPARPCL